MSVANEHLLRSLVALGNKIEDYNVEDAALTRTRTSEKLSLMVENKEWKKAARFIGSALFFLMRFD